jgi:hypothetical protein
MLPEACSVRITDEDDELHGQVAFIQNQPGDDRMNGETVPDGWYEVVLDPWGHGYRLELYREENIEVCGC